MSSQFEEDLVAAAKEDRQAFISLYERYVDRIFRYAYHMTGDEALAKDITSDTFEKALRSIHSYQSRGAGFGAWLYRIARNEVFQHHRRKRFQALLHPNIRSDVNVEGQVFQGIQEQQLFDALKRLSEKDRDILSLRFLEQLTSQEVADILKCSTNTFYVRLHRALNRLREEFEQIGRESKHSSTSKIEQHNVPCEQGRKT